MRNGPRAMHEDANKQPVLCLRPSGVLVEPRRQTGVNKLLGVQNLGW